MDFKDNNKGDGQTRIILIDDDPITILLATKILQNYNAALVVDHFTSGAAAIEYVRENELSATTIILLDIDMPLYTGWDFLNDFSSLKTVCSLFMFSSSIDNNDIERSKEYKKVKGFISKPLTPSKIEAFLLECIK